MKTRYETAKIRGDVYDKIKHICEKHDCKIQKIATNLVLLGLESEEYKEAEKKGLIF